MDILGIHIDQKLIFITTVTLTLFIVLAAVRKFILSKLKVIAEKTESKVDDYILLALGKTGHFFIAILSLYAGFYQYKSDKVISSLVDKTVIVIIAIQMGRLGSILISAGVENYFKRKNPNEIETERATIGLLTLTAKTVFFITLFLFVLHNLGINVTALVTGLGVGGIAIALAVQSILGDMIGSMSIIMDKPFVVGDYIVVDSLEGTVEDIGLKTTRLRSNTGEQLIFSNADLLKSRIKNLKRMNQRRISMPLGVTYDTPKDKVAKIPAILKEIVEVESNIRFDRCYFINFGASSLDFEFIYWVLSRDLISAREAQQSINLKILEAFEKEGISFAYPSQTLYLNQVAKN
jgi:small-conductance mechanosensitive channel